MNDAMWGIYLCQSRLNQRSRAADALLGLRASLEAARASIADPLRRGGVFSQYPHLFAALCTQLQKAGRTDSLLEAIEASKGRGVADILTRKAGIAVSDATVYAAAEQLPALTREHDFHYLTFFVDEHETYAALVTKIGDVLAVPPIALGQAVIREAATQADPREWDTRWGDNTASILSPLVEWLEDLVVEGVIEEDDHLCYAADEDLSNVPLQYLPVAGRPLIETVSLSRIHGAAHLAHVLAADAAPPARFHGFLAPTRQNRERPSWSELQRHLRQPIAWLGNHLEGDAVEEADASLEHVAGMDLRGQVLHFSAHGTFPQREADGTPFEHSGIILGFRGHLADEERLQARDLSGVLTPRRVLDAGLELSNSHVSLMSCVSGLSREGLGGDALGIEWALLQAGAQSLLAAHWNIDARVAAAFFERYYEHWLGEGTTRAQALRLTVREFREQPEPFSRSENWAAFSLTGDWR
jgi:hypothetical protein